MNKNIIIKDCNNITCEKTIDSLMKNISINLNTINYNFIKKSGDSFTFMCNETLVAKFKELNTYA
jgi:translation elongation factor P/translation initiation factor 5A